MFLAGRGELGLSRAHVQRLCRAGAVAVGGVTASPSRRLRSGERITIALPAAFLGHDGLADGGSTGGGIGHPAPDGPAPESIPLDVVHEDAQLIVVNKPRGLVVHPAPGNPSGTLVNALLARCPGLRGIGGELRPGIVHRLDKDTTGLMVAAKDERTLAALAAQIARHEVARRYLALVHGSPPESFVVDAPIGRDPANRKRMAVRPGEGRPARTHFRLRERFAAHALLEATLETGRTHQIRVHVAFAGFPIVADRVYGRRGSDPLGLSGQALHAFRLSFVHPATGRTLVCEAPPPPDFADALQRLREQPADG